MRKSTVFISALLTTFALVMLYRIASAYNSSKSADDNSKNVQEVATEPPDARSATEPKLQ
jgi:hypothetical protein